MMGNRTVSVWLLLLVSLCLAALTACGPSPEEIDDRIQQHIANIPTPVPTATVVQAATPAPTPTPVVLPTPLPTATPISFPPAPTPQPTPTPVTFPTPLPTATPITFPPTPTPQPIVAFNAVYLQTWPSVFLIETSAGRGSGWLIEPDLILTNQHVVAGSSTVTVRQPEDPPFTATILAVDSLRDIALLRFDAANTQLHPRAAPLLLGEISVEDVATSLMALGYSGDGVSGVNADGTAGTAAANGGVLSRIADFGSDSLGLNLIMDAPVDPGDSGGPVLNPEGLVVGMNQGVLEQTAGGQRVVGTFYAVHVDEIRSALPSLKAGQSR